MEKLTQELKSVLDSKPKMLSPEVKRVMLKEYLQSYLLYFIYNSEKYRKLNFYGGTCLRYLYGLNRLSEDLDLDNSENVGLLSFVEDLTTFVKNTMSLSNFTIKTQKGDWGIFRFTLKLPVLKELDLSMSASENLHLKIEISTHLQTADILHTPLFVYGRSFVPAHFSLESMMAGKIIACLERNFQIGNTPTFIKGRDFYDLLWFMQKGVVPNAKKLAKDGKSSYTVKSAFEILSKKIKTITSKDLALDVLSLFEDRVFIDGWLESFEANFSRFVKNYLL